MFVKYDHKMCMFSTKSKPELFEEKKTSLNTNEIQAIVQEYSERIPSSEKYYSSRHTST